MTKIEIDDWVYPKRSCSKAFRVREIIGERVAMTATDNERLYLGLSEVEKITDGLTLMELGNFEMN